MNKYVEIKSRCGQALKVLALYQVDVDSKVKLTLSVNALKTIKMMRYHRKIDKWFFNNKEVILK